MGDLGQRLGGILALRAGPLGVRHVPPGTMNVHMPNAKCQLCGNFFALRAKDHRIRVHACT